MTTYPTYWYELEGIYWLETKAGDLSTCLVIKGNFVEFEFYNGRKFESRVRQFSSPDKARDFAIRFGRLMRRLEKSRAVVPLWQFPVAK
jgi:hypothetical protein